MSSDIAEIQDRCSDSAGVTRCSAGAWYRVARSQSGGLGSWRQHRKVDRA